MGSATVLPVGPNRRVLQLVIALSAGTLGACGEGADESAGSPEATTRAATAVDGKALFGQRCSACHSLADAKARGTVGPDLDEVRPAAQRVEQKVRGGGGGMPAFAGQLSDAEIRSVAEYVAEAAGG